MVAKWSDFEESSESDNEDGQTHLCLIANDNKADDEEDNSKEVLVFLNSCSKDKSVKAFFDMFQIEQILKDEKKDLANRKCHYVESCEELIKKN